ncbi:MAG: hypothetical protein FWB74_00845 [Defluviitaleaceae bacterium]|nr:hypothetical protein [Defluviitaleaceae bacterium]
MMRKAITLFTLLLLTACVGSAYHPPPVQEGTPLIINPTPAGWTPSPLVTPPHTPPPEPQFDEGVTQALVYFLVGAYPQIFTREVIPETFGYSIFGDWMGFTGSAHMFTLHDISGRAPSVTIRLPDAGSAMLRTYIRADEEYVYSGIGIWTGTYYCDDGHFVVYAYGRGYVTIRRGEVYEFDEDAPRHPPRFLPYLTGVVYDLSVQALWQNLLVLDSGVVVDGNLDSAVVDLLLGYFEDREATLYVLSIKGGLVTSDDWVRVETTTNSYPYLDFTAVFFVSVQNNEVIFESSGW